MRQPLSQVSSRYAAEVAERPTMQRPGGRTARVRNAVHEAVIDLLDEQSWEELSIPAVAERSGVHQATIYRRWRTVPVLLDDVVAGTLTRAAPLPDTGTLRGDLDTYAAGVARGLTGPFRVLILRAAMVDVGSDGAPALSGVLAQRSGQLQEMLDRARDRGEAAPALDELIELVLAPLYFYALFPRPAGAADPPHLVDRLLDLAAERR